MLVIKTSPPPPWTKWFGSVRSSRFLLLEKSPQLPLGVKVLSSYATLTMGNNRITIVLRNNTNEWVEVQKGVPIARMVTANMIPPADLSSSPVKTSDSGRMSEEERQ